jgi:hypothetical protein
MLQYALYRFNNVLLLGALHITVRSGCFRVRATREQHYRKLGNSSIPVSSQSQSQFRAFWSLDGT